MAEPLSKRFIHEIDPARDALYVAALSRAESPRAAEALLQRAVRLAFTQFAEAALQGPAPAAIEAELARSTVQAAAALDAAMPADVWARLIATVQIEAARVGGTAAGGRAINPESVMMMSDPLLAPKKTAVDDSADGLNLSPPSRFVLAAGIAIVLGLALSIYIVSRRSASHPATMTAPAPSSAATSPATSSSAPGTMPHP